MELSSVVQVHLNGVTATGDLLIGPCSASAVASAALVLHSIHMSDTVITVDLLQQNCILKINRVN